MVFVEKLNDLIHHRIVLVISILREYGLCLHTNVYRFRFQWRDYINILNLQSFNLMVTFGFWDLILSRILILFFSSYVILFQHVTQLSSPFRLNLV